MSKILVIVPHLDDETFGMGGTLIKLAKNNSVKVISICKGRGLSDSAKRIHTFKYLGEKYNYKTKILDFVDLTLYEVSPAKLSNIILKEIEKFNPEEVYTVGEDLHSEHKLINNCVKVACRLRSVNVLYEMYIPGSSNINDFNINFVNEIDLKNKINSCKLYDTEVNDNLIALIEAFNKFIGLNVNTSPSEAFNIVFERRNNEN